MTCTRCQDLQVENERLRRALGLQLDAGQAMTIRRHFKLSPTQAGVVLALYNAGGKIVPKDVLVEEFIRPDAFPDTIKVHISRVRKATDPAFIENVAAIGYRLNPVARAQVYQALHREAA